MSVEHESNQHEEGKESKSKRQKRRNLLQRATDKLFPPEMFGALPHDLHDEMVEVLSRHKQVLSGEIANPEDIERIKGEVEIMRRNIRNYTER